MISFVTLLTIPLLSAATPLPQSSDPPTIPSGCTPPLTFPIVDFQWFNSTNNLDCTVSHPPEDRICWKTDPATGTGSVCDPAADASCTLCTPFCYVGVPKQPLGYGPPDVVSYSIPGVFSQCYEANPQDIRRYPVGAGTVMCGGAGSYSSFFGDSNAATGAGRIEFRQSRGCEDGNSRIFGYRANFDLACTRDAGFNATCTIGTPNPVASLVSVS